MFYLGAGQAKDGFELESEDEAMVRALGLALVWPSHGPEAHAHSAPAVVGSEA